MIGESFPELFRYSLGCYFVDFWSILRGVPPFWDHFLMPQGAIGHPRRHGDDFVRVFVDFGVHFGTLWETFFPLVGLFSSAVFWHGSGHHVLPISGGFQGYCWGNFG